MSTYSTPTVTIPYCYRFPGASEALGERMARRQADPFTDPLSPRSELLMIAAIIAVLAVVSAFLLLDEVNRAFGAVLAVMSVAVVAALLWARANGGIDASIRPRQPNKYPPLAQSRPAKMRFEDPSPAESPVTELPVAADPSIVPTQHVIGSRRSRLLAQLFDIALVVVPVYLMTVVLGTTDGRISGASPWLGLGFLLLVLLLEPLSMVFTNGRTAGKFLFNLRVVRADGARIRLPFAFKRELLLKWWHGHFWAIGDIMSMFADDLHRSEHDFAAKTFVVVDRSTPALPLT